MEYNKFAKVVSNNRQNKNMTQDEFALKLGVTPQAVSKWERGMGLPDISLIEGICTILSISSDELLGINFNTIADKNLHEQKDIINNLCSGPIALSIGEGLIPSIVAGLNTSLLHDKRRQLMSDTGMLIPTFRIWDNIDLKPNEYCIQSFDEILVKQELNEINDDTYYEIITKLFDTCRENYVRILNKQIVKSIIDTIKKLYPGVADDIIPEKISYLTYQKVLISIINKGGSIKNQIKIIECMEDEMICKGNVDIESISDIYLKNWK